MRISQSQEYFRPKTAPVTNSNRTPTNAMRIQSAISRESSNDTNSQGSARQSGYSTPMLIVQGKVFDEVGIRAQVRSEFNSSQRQFKYKNPVYDASYHIKETPIIKTTKETTYMDLICKKAQECAASSQTYSKIQDWTKNTGQKMKKEKRITFFQQLMNEKKKIPGSNKYTQWIKPKTIGSGGKLNAPKISILEEMSYEKKQIPASNQYNVFKGLAQISKERNIPFNKKEKNKMKIQIKRKKAPVTPAPGHNLDDKKLDYVRVKSARLLLNKAQNKTYIQMKEVFSKKIPGVGSYETLESYKKVSMTPSLRRSRI